MSKITRRETPPPGPASKREQPLGATKPSQRNGDPDLDQAQRRFTELLKHPSDGARKKPAAEPQAARGRQPPLAKNPTEYRQPGEQNEQRRDDAARRMTGGMASTTPPNALSKPFSNGARAQHAADAHNSGDVVPKPSDRKHKQAGNPSLQGMGDQILQGLTAPLPQTPNSAAHAATPGAEQISELAQQLAQRILVSDTAHGDPAEVRIQLKSAVLDGAEVSIRQEQGQILVSFHVNSDQAKQALSPQLGHLQQLLNERLQPSVRVELHSQTDASQEQNDGRSRNRRDLWDNDDETRY